MIMDNTDYLIEKYIHLGRGFKLIPMFQFRPTRTPKGRKQTLYRFIVISLLFVSIYCVFQIELECFWSIPTENAAGKNRIILGIYYSYIAAYFFAFLTEYLPAKENRHAAQVVCQLELERIYLQMEEIVKFLLARADIKKDINKITKNDCSVVTNLKWSKSPIYYEEYRWDGGKQRLLRYRKFVSPESFEEFSKEIKDTVTNLFSSPPSGYLDKQLLYALASIRSADLLVKFEQVRSYKQNEKEFSITHLGDAFYEFLQFQQKLKKFDLNYFSLDVEISDEATLKDKVENREFEWLLWGKTRLDKDTRLLIPFWSSKEK